MNSPSTPLSLRPDASSPVGTRTPEGLQEPATSEDSPSGFYNMLVFAGLMWVALIATVVGMLNG